MEKVRIAGVIEESIVDGPGVRYVIFFQGCKHFCKGCQNPQTWDFNGGREEDIQDLIKDIQNNRLIKGVTLSGGDPIYQADKVLPLAKELKKLGYNIYLYTGHLFEDIRDLELVKYVDFIVDGEFILSQKSLALRFKGSSNQRIIDVQESLKSGSVVQIG